MALRINRVRAVTASDAAFSGVVTALPEGANRCLCCRRRSLALDSLAIILVADESDDEPRALCAAVCSMCSTTHPTDQLLADWTEQLTKRYGGTDIPDKRFSPI